jgi:hypothetical protein
MSDTIEQPVPTTTKGKLWQRFKGLPLMKMLKVIGFICGILSICLGFWNLFTSLLLPKSIIFGVYNILFGLLMMICEMRWSRFLKHFKFLTHFIGLGLFYIFVGGLALGSAWYALGLGITLIIIGTVYTLLGLCGLRMGHEELPKFMQRQDTSTTETDVEGDIGKAKLTKQSTSSSSATTSPEPTTYMPPTYKQSQKSTLIKPNQPAPRQEPEISISINNSAVDNEYAIQSQSHNFADTPTSIIPQQQHQYSIKQASKQPGNTITTTTTTVTSSKPLSQPGLQNKYDDYNPFE